MKYRIPLCWTVIKLLLRILLLLTLTVQLKAHFSGGQGTEDNPWKIGNSADLDNVRYYLGEAHSDNYFRQVSDIDLKTSTSPDGGGWLPIGSKENPFSGNYDGNGQLILNLTISRPDSSNQGLFGVVKDADIRRLGLRDVSILGGSGTGALIGLMRATNVEQCYVTGNVSGVDAVGGLVGHAKGREVSRIADCYSTAVVHNLGANFQTNLFVRIRRTINHVNIHDPVVGSQRVGYNGTGGLVGFLHRGELLRCYVTGPVLFDYENQMNTADPVVLTRTPYTYAYNSYWNTDVTDLFIGTRQRGNIFGRNSNQLMQAETFEGFDFDEVWAIDEGQSFPYLVWEGHLAKSHNQPPLMPPAGISATLSDRTVKISWEIKNDFMGLSDGFNIYRNGMLINEIPLTDNKYTDEGLEYWNIYKYYITALYEGEESAPSEIFSIAPVRFAGGTGTAKDPYLVKTREHLNGVRYSLRSSYLQTADICLADSEWIPIGDFGMAFSGIYDGNNHYISNMTISNIPNAGLFRIIKEAELENIRLKDIRLVDVGENSGGLVGVISAAHLFNQFRTDHGIKNCSVTGSISSSANNIGGLAGYMGGFKIDSSLTDVIIVSGGNNTGGFIGYTHSYSQIDMSGAQGEITVQGKAKNIGGFVGKKRQSRLLNSYTLVGITASPTARNVGGFLGLSIAQQPEILISNCFAAAKISGGSESIGGFIGNNNDAEITENSYWDIETSGQSDSAGGEGRTTAEMTFPHSDNTYVGWNFNQVWRSAEEVDINNGYPYHNIPGPTSLMLTTSVYTKGFKRYNELTWETDRDVKAYRIYRNDEMIASVSGDQSYWRDNDVDMFERYSYHITAIHNVRGKDVESDKSNVQTTKPIRQ